MANNNTQKEITDRVAVEYYASKENKTRVEETYAHLTFEETESAESISFAALKLLNTELNDMLQVFAQQNLTKGAILPGKNHCAYEDSPEDAVNIDGHVRAVSKSGGVTEANINLQFNYTDTVESISWEAAKQLGKDLQQLVAKIEKEAQANRAEQAER